MAVWQEIVDYTVPSNATSVVLDDFGTITKDDFVKVVFSNIMSQTTGNTIAILPNDNTTRTNYHVQRLLATGTSVIAQRQNNNNFGDTLTTVGAEGFTFAYLKLSENDRFNAFANTFYNTGSDVRTDLYYNTSSNGTFPSGITSLTFNASQTNGIGAGTRIQIYKLAATKVADITVSANATQVDIEDLVIDKDGEYLLVSDAKNATTSTVEPQLFINDNNTSTNYYSQALRAIPTAYAARGNYAAFMQLPRTNVSPPPENNTGYTHIKLSNIGAYTWQSYNIITGGSNIQVGNWFGSSTAENITSITKISIVVPVSNAIAAGSRFMLYKLY